MLTRAAVLYEMEKPTPYAESRPLVIEQLSLTIRRLDLTNGFKVGNERIHDAPSSSFLFNRFSALWQSATHHTGSRPTTTDEGSHQPDLESTARAPTGDADRTFFGCHAQHTSLYEICCRW
ncbi:hypothetical protein F1729_14990 [Gimesia maris]|nr:hypothetical protein F1729_14990 [Gimesia maris]